MSKKPKRTCAIKVVASSDKPVFASVAEELERVPQYVEEADECAPEDEPAPVESEEQLHSDMVRLVLERIEVKEAASESAKTFRRKIEAIDAQVESLARRLDTMGLVETFERVADCDDCGARNEWASESIDELGETTVSGTDDRKPGLSVTCLVCGYAVGWGDILVVRRRPNGELVDTRPVLASETQLAIGAIGVEP